MPPSTSFISTNNCAKDARVARLHSTKFDTHGDVVLGTATWKEDGRPNSFEVAPNTPMIRVRLVLLDQVLNIETYDAQQVTAPVRDDNVNAWAATDHNGKVVYVFPLSLIGKGDEFTLTPANYQPPAQPRAGVLGFVNLEGWHKY